jgi:hypothetical protein
LYTGFTEKVAGHQRPYLRGHGWGRLAKKKECPMSNRQRIWIWIAAAVSFVVGIVFILSDGGAGWFFVILGMTYLGISTRAGQTWAESNPRLTGWGLVGGALLLVLLAVGLGTLFRLR